MSALLSLAIFYGTRFQKLNGEEKRLLALDLLGVMEEERCTSAKAVVLLDERIENKLEPYVASLVAGANRRKKT